jgi:hypothetical protein
VLARSASRLPFACAVALIAAAIGDPLVETISNTGIFGQGYLDNNHLSVIPTLIAGVLLFAIITLRRMWMVASSPCHPGLVEERPHTTRDDDWLVDIARYVSAKPPTNDLALIVVLQFVALFGMESAEQLALGGRLVSGTTWLGGPVLFSLLAHTLVTVACTLIVARAMRSIVRHLARIVGTALEILLDIAAPANAGIFARRRDGFTVWQTQSSYVRRVGERAPPLLGSLI